MIQLSWKFGLRLRKLNIELPSDPAILLLGTFFAMDIGLSPSCVQIFYGIARPRPPETESREPNKS